MSEENQDYINQSAWQDLLTENVLLPVIDNAGVKVGDDEMVDLSRGQASLLAFERAFLYG